jgi:hypothetical protein
MKKGREAEGEVDITCDLARSPSARRSSPGRRSSASPVFAPYTEF